MPVSEDEWMRTDQLGNGQLGNMQAAITAADESHALTDADANLGATTQAELEAVFDELAARINACITALEYHRLNAEN